MSVENRVQSFKVATTLSAYRGVYVSAAHTVAYVNAATSLPVGITIDDVKDTNQGIPVAVSGAITKLYFNDTVAAGGLVAIDSSGRGIPFAAAATSTTQNHYVGVLIGAAVAATGTIAQVMVQPGLK